MRKSGTAATITAQLNKANLPGKLTNRTYIIKPINVSVYWDKPVFNTYVASRREIVNTSESSAVCPKASENDGNFGSHPYNNIRIEN